MIKVKGKHVYAKGEPVQLLVEVTLILLAICPQVASEKRNKYEVLEKIYSTVKEMMEQDDGIAGGGGSDE